MEANKIKGKAQGLTLDNADGTTNWVPWPHSRGVFFGISLDFSKFATINQDLAYNNYKYEKATILIILRGSHADGMWTAGQTGRDYGFR